MTPRMNRADRRAAAGRGFPVGEPFIEHHVHRGLTRVYDDRGAVASICPDPSCLRVFDPVTGKPLTRGSRKWQRAYEVMREQLDDDRQGGDEGDGESRRRVPRRRRRSRLVLPGGGRTRRRKGRQREGGVSEVPGD